MTLVEELLSRGRWTGAILPRPVALPDPWR